MGIRFFCPNGHKLHVKDFQAGRRGICPHCGVSMDIPLTSTRPSSKKRSASATSVEGDGSGVVHIEQHEDEPIALDDRMLHSAPSTLSASAPATSVASTPSPASPASDSMAANDRTDPNSARAASSIPAPGTPSGPPAHGPRRPVDPLDEAPTAVWYVRPPSGGQFGPAARDVMRTWLAEGRVSADSLVWREGWRDWNTASEVFPQFSPTVKTPPQLDFLDDEVPRSMSVRRPAAAAGTHARAATSPKPTWFWIALGVGVALLLAAVGAIVYVNYF